MHVSVILSALLLAGCTHAASPTDGAVTKAPPSPIVETAPAASPAPTERNSSQAVPEIRELPGGLTLEAYPLVGPPTLDPLTFQPASGTQAQVLARHAAEREKVYVLDLRADDQFRPTLTASWEGGLIVARIETDPTTQEQTAELWHGDQMLFSVPAGFPSPAPALQGLWIYDSHWALELLMATPDEWIGQVYLDGRLLNDQLGYDEVFGFQLIDGRPFYFFLQGGSIGVSVDGQAVDLDYNSIPHYECCSGSELNPVKAHSMVAFFAQEAGQWRYVEIGAFNGG